MIVLIFYFLLALTVSFVCSLMESVLLTVSHGHVELLIDEGKRSGRILKQLKERIEYPLSAILTLNTIANTVGAAGVGAQALKVGGNRWAAVASAILTLCILVFSEVLPKTLGVLHWKRLASPAAYIIRGLIVVAYPFVVAFRGFSRLIARQTVPPSRVTREEMIALAGIGEDEGTLGGKEKTVIENLLRLRHVRAGDVMTPRAVLVALPRETTVGEVMERRNPLRFSRIPVYDRNLDEIRGVVLRWAILEAFARGERERQVGDLARPLHGVPDTHSVAGVLDDFIRRREHIFLVVDEYGGTEGIITLEDAVETLLGVEIVDELDSVDDMRQFALERWETRRKKLNLPPPA